MKKIINKVKGFTLTELAIVIAVIAILIAVLVPTFIALIDKANESKDTQMIYNVNNALAIESATTTIETPAKALDVAEKAGYKIENLTPTSDSEIYYDQENVRFIIVYSDGTRYPSSSEDTDLNSPTVWRFVDEATYQSILAQDTSSATEQSSKTAAKTAVKAEDVASAPVTHTVSYIAKGEWTTSFDYTGMGGVDTTRATGITQVNYTIQIVENTTYAINPIYSVSDEVKKVAVVSAVEGEISVKKSCGQNTYTTAEAAEGVTCSLTFEVAADDSSPILYDTSTTSTITVIVTQNGEDVTEDVTESIDLAESADFSTGVLELGTVKYPYLIASEDDYYKVNYGGYCKVTANINASSTLTISNVTIILDLNGHSLTSSGNKTISVAEDATLTINGTGTITTSATTSKAIDNLGSLTLNDVTISGSGYGVYTSTNKTAAVTLTINGGSISSTGNYSIYVNATKVSVEINSAKIKTTGSLKYAIYNGSGTVTINGKDTEICSTKGAAIYSTSAYSAVATININDGYITSANKYAINVKEGTTINMTGGTVEATSRVAGTIYCGISLASATGTYDATTLNISGGEVISNGSYGIYVNGKNATSIEVNISGTASVVSKATNSSYCVGVLNNKGVVNVSGGTITAENGVGIYNNAYSGNELNISGGTISGNRGIENLYTMTMTGGTVIGEEIAVYIAEGTAGMLTSISGNAVVKVDSSVENAWSYGIYLGSGMSLSISGNAEIMATNVASATSGIFCVGSGDSSKYTTMTISGGTISGDAYGIAGNGSNAYTDVTISGGSIIGGTVGYYHPEIGNLTITGGSIEGYYAGLQICAGTVTISGGTFTATATNDDMSGSSANVTDKTGDGAIADGAALSIINRNGYGTYSTTGSSITKVTVTGGTFTTKSNEDAIQVYSYLGTNIKLNWNDVDSYVTISVSE